MKDVQTSAKGTRGEPFGLKEIMLLAVPHLHGIWHHQFREEIAKSIDTDLVIFSKLNSETWRHNVFWDRNRGSV